MIQEGDFPTNPSGPSPRLWPLRALSVLLAGQGLAFAAYAIYRITAIDWTAEEDLLLTALSPAALDAVTVALYLGALAPLALIAALLLPLLLRAGWLLGMVVQAVTLAVALVLYVQERPTFIYPVMVVSILMVGYLNLYEIRALILPPPEIVSEGAADE